MQTIDKTTDTFSRFRELQRNAGAIPNSTNGLVRVYMIHGDEGNVLEIGYAPDVRLALMKSAEKITSNSITEQVRHARGIIVEAGQNAHYPKSEHSLEPDKLENDRDLEDNYHTTEIVLTIGADNSGTWVRSSIPEPGALPIEAVESRPMIEVEQINSDHPLAPVVSLIESLAMAVDVARQIVGQRGSIPDRPLDD